MFSEKNLHKVMFTYLLAEKFMGSHFEFFVENVVRGNSVQIAPNFPAKSLSIYLNEFFLTLFWLFNGNSLIRRQNTCIFVYSLKYVRTKIKITKWNSKQHYWLVFNNNMVKYARNLTILQKRKKTAHAYFGRLYFF